MNHYLTIMEGNKISTREKFFCVKFTFDKHFTYILYYLLYICILYYLILLVVGYDLLDYFELICQEKYMIRVYKKHPIIF